MLRKQEIGFLIMTLIFFVALFLSFANSGILATLEHQQKYSPYL